MQDPKDPKNPKNPNELNEKYPTAMGTNGDTESDVSGSNDEIPFSFEDVDSNAEVNGPAEDFRPKKKGFLYKSGDNKGKTRAIIPILVLLFVVVPFFLEDNSSVHVEILCEPHPIEEHKKFFNADGSRMNAKVNVNCDLRDSKDTASQKEAFCTLTEVIGTSPVQACWNVVMQCDNQADIVSRQCLTLQDGETKNHVIPASSFPLQNECVLANEGPRVSDLAVIHETLMEISCTAEEDEGTRTVEACWETIIDCTNQPDLMAKRCLTLSDGEKKEVLIPASELKAQTTCETVPGKKGFQVKNLELDLQ
jgi:hypothetical protein